MRPSGRRTIAATFGRNFTFCIAAKVRSLMFRPQEIFSWVTRRSGIFRRSMYEFPEGGASGYALLPLMSQQIKKALNRIFGLVLKLLANALLQRARNPFREIFLWILRSTRQLHWGPLKAISFLGKDFLFHSRQPFHNRLHNP